MSKRCMGCMEYYGDEFEICPHCGYIEGTPPEEAIHMEPGTLLHDRYIIGRVLGFKGGGQGIFARRVFHAYARTIDHHRF